MRRILEHILNALWYGQQHGWLAILLSPIAWLYRVLAKRNWQKYHAQRQKSFAVPVVVIGNIVAGGSGKTPVTQALALALQAQGLCVGIVSRGYGGTTTLATVVDITQPHRFGDEPCLLAATTGCVVVVAAQRHAAVTLLCGLSIPKKMDIILSDDGMQHAGLHRDFEICVMSSYGVGNGCGLPSGPLREPINRLKTVQAILSWDISCAAAPDTVPQWVVHGKHAPLQLLNGTPAPEGTLQTLASLQTQQNIMLYTAAGLAHPDKFYQGLASAGLRFKTLAVADHGTLIPAQLNNLPSQALLIITEKDAVKLRYINNSINVNILQRIRVLPWRVNLPTVLVDMIVALMIKH
jgi:tetraacyldisaccharide 4'-kinase